MGAAVQLTGGQLLQGLAAGEALRAALAGAGEVSSTALGTGGAVHNLSNEAELHISRVQKYPSLTDRTDNLRQPPGVEAALARLVAPVGLADLRNVLARAVEAALVPALARGLQPPLPRPALPGGGAALAGAGHGAAALTGFQLENMFVKQLLREEYDLTFASAVSH